MLNIQQLIDDAQCFAVVRELRWPDGVVQCPHCDATAAISKRGRVTTQPAR